MRAGLFLFLLFVAAALFGFFMPEHPMHHLSQSLAPPSFQHWFGCDAYGIDLGERVLAGANQSLFIALTVTTFTLSIGLFVGSVSVLSPRWFETLLVRAIDCFIAFPGLLLAILIASLMPHSQMSILFALTITGWTGHARFCRALSLKLSREPFIEAAKANGATSLRILFCHIWPSIYPQLLVQAALSMGSVILAEASLSFLGLGASFDNPSWGKLIAEGREYLVEAPHLSFFPGAAFVCCVFAFNLIAEGLRKKLDSSARLGLY